MEAYKVKTKHYYKYLYEPWVQPILTGTEVLGHNFFAVADNCNRTQWPAWAAFNGVTQPFWGPADTVDALVSLTLFIQKPVHFDTLTWVTFDANRFPTSWILYGSNDRLEWTELCSGTNDQNNFTLEFDYEGYYTYYRFDIPTSNNGVNAATISFTGTHRVAIESTIDYYDYFVEYNEYKSSPQVQQDKLQKIPHIFYDNTHRLLANNYLEVPPGSNCLWISHPDVFPHTGLHVYGNWEFQLKICRTVGTESFFRIWHLGGHYRFVDWYEYNGDFRIATVHDPNRSWTDHYWASDCIPFAKWVWIRLRKVGASWVCSQSEDGITFRDKSGFTHDVDWPYYSIQLMEGVKGIIDLNESHIKKWADDESSCEYWWSGTSERKVFGDTPYNELSEKYTQYSVVRSDNGN